jgi:vancomycin resistance protein YoaR
MLLRRPIIPSVPAPLRHVSRTARRSRVTGAFRATTWSMLAFLLVFPVVMNFATHSSDEVLSVGTQVGDVSVGGMNVGAARDAVADRVQELTAQPARVTINDENWSPLPAELGVMYDAEASLAALAAFGQDDDQDLTQLVPLAISFNPAVFTTWIDSRLADLGGAAVNASVTIDGVDATMTPGKSGLVIDRPMVEAMLLEQVSSLQPISLTAEAAVGDPTITTEEAETARIQVEEALAEPYVLTEGEQSWTLAPEQVAPALHVVPTSDGLLQLSWDAAALDAIVGDIAVEVDADAADSWVQDLGTKSWLVPAEEGKSLDRQAFVVSMHEALANGDHEIALPVSVHASPEVTTEEQMAQLGITDVVGVGDSVYAGSGPGRTNNVEVAAYMVDGTLVPPGEVFSFNAAVGDLFNGMYMDAGSYLDGPNGQSLAGGVCQVSTTVFRAALDAGFPIEEWWQHSYRSPFYEMGGWSPGFDASIVQNSAVPEESTDFQFRNTTNSWLMVSAKTVDGELKVELLGAETGYAVTFDEPVVEVVEWATDEVSVVTDEQLPPGTVEEQPAMDGLRVTVVRYVYDAEGNLVSEDTFVSTYGSYGAIRRVSPDMAEAAYGQ